MGIEEFQKVIISEGNKTDYPPIGAMIEMHYTGCLYDADAPNNMGTKFDSSYDRGTPLPSKIGVGRLIQGWDIGVPQMSLGEKAYLRIPFHMAYGERGFPPVIPPMSDLVFQVELVSISGKRA
ncbi:peptidyl-prolyl cis-trans isomerase [Penicillium verhagenii]|uniref:peptidyl-prolyl cis-trans isomerase n=1 Tax=Penicillium verhagenii TaxID=1562060 RepID=UPI0025450B13|nr:peptidyl-prolyl cis-trans isomerase [Penicillium verhagenii]KAJ5935571.1 peptidyl-prolyl cis-trans isomerase [Penicillium verhagenii]